MTGEMCEWFALCDRPATKKITHPVLGDVPVCDRCFERGASPSQKEEEARNGAAS